ncbi:hypothetical protein TrVFT333_006804 [Trichoderma virens FT-333]|nr:hypothetical protein TrVFT333_006804 [Trichoderma virens FT-333]
MAKERDGMPSLLFETCEDESMLEVLFAKATDLEVRDDEGLTPLAWAIFTRNIVMAQFLLARNVNIETRDNQVQNDDNFTPLALTVVRNHYTATKVLMDNRANVNYRQPNGRAVSHMAVERASRDIIALLLEADTTIVDVVDNDGFSPLSFAVITPMWYAKNQAKDERLIQILLRHSAEDLDVDDSDNPDSDDDLGPSVALPEKESKRRLSNDASDTLPRKRRH